MAYSSDLRKRVLDFLKNGGKKSEALRRFTFARSTLYRWLEAKDPLATEKPGPRAMGDLDEAALKRHVADFPNLTQNEKHFGVSASSIGYGLRKLGITRKKHSGISNAVMINAPPIVKTLLSNKPPPTTTSQKRPLDYAPDSPD